MNPINNITDDRKLSILAHNPQFPVILKKRPQRRNRTVRYNEENRIMSKSGRIHVHLYKIPGKSIRYVRDLWNTLVNMRWRWLMFTVALVNMFAYLIFAAFFMFDAWISGDFEHNENHKICIKGVENFTSFFMLGIETITTTGYGYFHPTEYCQLVWIVLWFSTLVTIFIDGAFISVVYVKISRPSYRVSKKLFSNKAVVTLRNGKLCFIFRLNDRIGKHRINTKVKLFLVQENISKEGELLPNYITELQLKPYGVLLWPIEIVHEITKDSPLWNISAKALMTAKFELVAQVSGCSVLTGQASISQTSYLSKEILWGFQFSRLMEYNTLRSQYVLNYKNFQSTEARDTPLCSANHLNDVEKEIRNRNKKRRSIDCLYLSSDQETL